MSKSAGQSTLKTGGDAWGENQRALERATADALNSDFFKNSKAGQRALRVLQDAPTQLPAREEDLSALYTMPGAAKAQRAAAFARIDNDPALNRAMADAENSDYFRQGRLGARARRAVGGEDHGARSWDDPFQSPQPPPKLVDKLSKPSATRNSAGADLNNTNANRPKVGRISAEHRRDQPAESLAGQRGPTQDRGHRVVRPYFENKSFLGSDYKTDSAGSLSTLLADLKALKKAFVSGNPYVEVDVNLANKAESTFASHLVPGPGGFVLGVALNTATDKGVKNDDVTTGEYWRGVGEYSAILKVIEIMAKAPAGPKAPGGPRPPMGPMPPQVQAVVLATLIYDAYKSMEKQDKIDEIAALKKHSPFGPHDDGPSIGLPGHDPAFKHTLPLEEQKGDIYKGWKFQNWSQDGGGKPQPTDPAAVDVGDEIVFWLDGDKDGDKTGPRPPKGHADRPVDLPYGGNGSKDPKDSADGWNGPTIGLPPRRQDAARPDPFSAHQRGAPDDACASARAA